MNVLDKGWVELVETMGDDCSPAEAARVSYGNKKRGWEEGDGRLTSYLLSHEHLTPFEMIELKFKVKAPIFVARQWMRHRTASYNEFSMRYSEAGKISDSGHIDIYQPDIVGMGNLDNNKQASSAMRGVPEASRLLESAYDVAIETYEELIATGVSREHARMVLPVATYTVFMYKTNLRNFWHFISLRSDEAAQWEIRQYSDAMAQLATEVYPNLMKLWHETK